MQVTGSGDFALRAGGSAVTVGAYDGVHLGHRRLLERMLEHAHRLSVESVVVTFDRHPAAVVRPESAPPLLTDLEQKLELLAACGVDTTLVLAFDSSRAEEPAEQFVTSTLVETLGARVVVVGGDFHFGHRRMGDVGLLRSMGHRYGFEVDGVELTAEGGTPVSSTRIRGLVAEGRVAEAAALLGHVHEVRGPVVKGDGRGGSLLGFPTANVAVPSEIAVPGVGIYAGWCTCADGLPRPAAISVGRRPTFYDPADGGAPAQIEAHILGFQGDLYGQRVRLAFADRLRDERRFERIEDLVDQMARDVAQVDRLLSRAPGPDRRAGHPDPKGG
ncbi:MAG: bifunctional riboflavin kinase/FAD synthetase [Actinomycetota bacterium]|jgi:riboflavin kinase/FMN adenylyltransferase|nr:bifunctional riboflavin kinase/FAD synthetase [Actinomycetota bacterium]